MISITRVALLAPPFTLEIPPAGIWIESTRSGTWLEGARMPTWIEPDREATWSSIMPATNLVKCSTEIRKYAMDFSNLPEISGGDTIDSVTSVLTIGTSVGTTDTDLTVTDIGNDDETGYATFADGIDGGTYRIIFNVVTTAGWTLSGIGYMLVLDQ